MFCKLGWAQLESSDDLGWTHSCVPSAGWPVPLMCLLVVWLWAVVLARCSHHPSGQPGYFTWWGSQGSQEQQKDMSYCASAF